MDTGLDYLLELHGSVVNRDDGYWWKIEAWESQATRERPHGIHYRLTLHNKYNTRVFGMDNAHGIKVPKKKGFAAKRHEFDHVHRTASDKGTHYEFVDCATLLQDFFEGIDSTIKAIEGK